jgi:hypothetical protein
MMGDGLNLAYRDIDITHIPDMIRNHQAYDDVSWTSSHLFQLPGNDANDANANANIDQWIYDWHPSTPSWQIDYTWPHWAVSPTCETDEDGWVYSDTEWKVSRKRIVSGQLTRRRRWIRFVRAVKKEE